jgi:hypothetical protein
MEKQKRIYWEQGLDITPGILIKSDNYHISRQSTIVQAFSYRLYGVLPGENFEIAAHINNNNIIIDKLYCTAITQYGHLIDIENDTAFDELSLQELTNVEYFVVLKVNPFSSELKDKYNLDIKESLDNIGNAIPVLKIYYNNDGNCWEIDKDYILPQIALSTSEALVQNYSNIKEALIAFIEKIQVNELTCFQTKLFETELKNYSLNEPPYELILLLKKIITVCKIYLEKVKKTNETLTALIEKFLQTAYNHNDVFPLIQAGTNCLTEINAELDVKPEPKPVENLGKI